jgi:exosortase D (VPLPA-CTERM-specific)
MARKNDIAVLTMALGLGLLILAAWDGVTHAVAKWATEEYSFAYFIPFLIVFFIWQRTPQLAREAFDGAWAGPAAVLLGAFLILFGELSTIYTVMQYGFALGVMGIVLSLMGWRAFRWVFVPLSLLFFAIPLPAFFYNNLSQSLQLLSSEIGVWFIRLFGISVFLEGNVIQLATMQLQVVEACSGLRYLFPLMAVGFIVAYIYRAPFWKRFVLFLSTVPITVLMNSLRVALIGVTVEVWDREVAEGMLHDFEGWVVFMVSLVVLLLEMGALNLIGKERRPFHEVFNLDFPGPLPEGVRFGIPRMPPPLGLSLGILLVTVVISTVLPSRDEVVPERMDFERFPLQLGQWQGEMNRLEPMFVDALRLDDSLIIEFEGPSGDQVQLYSAFYGSQRKGGSVHSPRSCIPGGGWELGPLSQRTITGTSLNGQSLRVNRVLIKKGDATQLVYYWFRQRGRLLTNEYLVKWYLFHDALLRSRTDGALVRLTTAIPPGQDVARADDYLTDLARRVSEQMGPFIPD